MAVKFTKIGRSPEEVFSYAASTIHDFLQEELEYTTDQTVKVVKSITPVYDPIKYPSWNTRYHNGVHGLLKKSIKRKKVTQGKRTLRTAIYSNKRYSSYVERGFRHKLAKRWIYGRFYIGVPMKVVHKRMFPRRIVVAFKKAFKEV
jgi:hypothetical protein